MFNNLNSKVDCQILFEIDYDITIFIDLNVVLKWIEWMQRAIF